MSTYEIGGLDRRVNASECTSAKKVAQLCPSKRQYAGYRLGVGSLSNGDRKQRTNRSVFGL
jgi:hypothetical protein